MPLVLWQIPISPYSSFPFFLSLSSFFGGDLTTDEEERADGRGGGGPEEEGEETGANFLRLER